MQKQKKLLLKLGTQCNLGCPHCHQTQKCFKEHPGLVNWIKSQKFDRISFSGGEPLIYFETIKRIMESVGHEPHYRMMSNTTLLTKEMAEFFNGYHISFGVSYDGELGGRDLSIPIQWKNLQHMKSWGLSTVFSTPDFSFRQFTQDFERICRDNQLHPWADPEFLKVSWIHQTKDAPNPEFTKEVADWFIKQSTLQIDKALYCLSQDERFGQIVRNLIGRWYSRKPIEHGVLCCNESMISVNLDGTIMLCPYGKTAIGSIDAMPSIDTLDSFTPEKCKGCEHWEICRCSCVASVTDLDCYVNRMMIPRVEKLISKHGLSEKIQQLFDT